MSEDEPNLLNPLEVKTVSADDRGRAYLGGDYREMDVKIAIIETDQIMNGVELESVNSIVWEDEDGTRYRRFWDGDELRDVEVDDDE